MNTTQLKLQRHWTIWLLENLANQVDKDKIIKAMTGTGISAADAIDSIGYVENNPLFPMYVSQFKKRQKLEALLDLDNTFRNFQGAYDKIDEWDILEPEAFIREYLYKNRPVLVRRWTRNWAALKKWDLDYFQHAFGDQIVEITTDRNRSSRYDIEFDRFKSELPFSDYIDMIRENPDSNDFYLVARNLLLKDLKFQSLFGDFAPIPGVLDPSAHNGSGYIKLWIGPKGTISKLHHDRVNVLLIQVKGRKQVKFIPPNQISKLYNNSFVYSDLELEQEVDLVRFPKAKNLNLLDIIVNPGDALLIPVGWWHWVKSLDISFTLTHQKFLIPGGNIFLHDNYTS